MVWFWVELVIFWFEGLWVIDWGFGGLGVKVVVWDNSGEFWGCDVLFGCLFDFIFEWFELFVVVLEVIGFVGRVVCWGVCVVFVGGGDCGIGDVFDNVIIVSYRWRDMFCYNMVRWRVWCWEWKYVLIYDGNGCGLVLSCLVSEVEILI